MLFQLSVSVLLGLHWYNKIDTIKSINGNLAGKGFFDVLGIRTEPWLGFYVIPEGGRS